MTAVFCQPDLSTRPYDLTVEQAMAASADLLYEAWTTGFERWLAAPGTLQSQGEANTPYFFEAIFDGMRFPHYGRFLRLERDRQVELTWLTIPTQGAETVITIDLIPDGDGTRLRLTHAGFPDAESRDEHEAAWPGVLADLDRKLAAK
jgi:uncharacterized protein YndB with AHSA1/START domain